MTSLVGQILAELGYQESDVAELTASGVVHGPRQP